MVCDWTCACIGRGLTVGARVLQNTYCGKSALRGIADSKAGLGWALPLGLLGTEVGEVPAAAVWAMAVVVVMLMGEGGREGVEFAVRRVACGMRLQRHKTWWWCMNRIQPRADVVDAGTAPLQHGPGSGVAECRCFAEDEEQKVARQSSAAAIVVVTACDAAAVVVLRSSGLVSGFRLDCMCLLLLLLALHTRAYPSFMHIARCSLF